MTNDEWNECDDALLMLEALKAGLPSEAYRTLKPTLWRYMLACCDEIAHLLPQQAIQDGLQGAALYLDGKIDREELNRLGWHAEAECFSLEYDGITIRGENPIENIPDLSAMTRAEALKLVTKAAYFADSAMNGLIPRKKPWRTKADFCNPDLLRRFLPARFDH